MSQVRLSRRANADLDAIADYIGHQNPAAAVSELGRLLEKFWLLADHPLLGERREELRPGLRSFPCGNYVIFYRPRTDGIEVLAVVHGARDIGAVFPDHPGG